MSTKTEQMIARYVRGGGNEATGRGILADVIRRHGHDADSLAYALHFWGLATERQAHRFAEGA